jgi:integrase
VEPSRLSLGSYLEAWVRNREAAGLRPSTIADYRRKVDAYVLRDEIAEVPLQQVSALDLDALYGRLLASGKRNGDGLSPRTVRYVATILSKALSDAERRGIVARNVAKHATPPSASAADPAEMRVWSPSELGAFLDSIDGTELAALVTLTAMTGPRRGEAVALRWEDVDLGGGHLTVSRNITTAANVPVEGKPKTKRSRRRVDLDPDTARMLRAHRTAQLEQRLVMGEGWGDHVGRVFTQADGTYWHPDRVSRVFDRLVQASGLPRIRFHDLRHSHCTHLLAAGVNARVVADRLGHASVAFTLQRYGHVLPGQQAHAAAAVAGLVRS